MKNLKISSKVLLALLLSLVFTAGVFANDEFTGMEMHMPVIRALTFFASEVQAEEEITVIPEGIINNHFYLESLRYTRLALETYEYGDYLASAGFAQEAIRYAELSDEFVAEQLIDEANRLFELADANNMATRFPSDYRDARNYFESGVIAHSNEEWQESITATINSIEILAMLESGGTAPLPRQYTVRTWASVRDCLWNIAGYPFVYGDPWRWRWRELYNANRSRLPDPNNPDLIEPGFVIEIPSIRGENRQGMWDPNRTYRP